MKPNAEIPKVIWFTWLQGLEHAPHLVRRCLQSWKEKNPDWTINLIDERSLSSYLDLPAIIDVNRRDLSVQKIVNIIRMNLLDKYGGVWVDATCYCCEPLDEWLHGYTEMGFFVFRDPGVDRVLSSWFMASASPHQLTKHVCQEVNAFWQKNYFSNQNTSFGNFQI